jgi:hypothetical protein
MGLGFKNKMKVYVSFDMASLLTSSLSLLALLIQRHMALRTISFFPGCSDINRMLELQCIPDICELHHISFTLADYCMAKITVSGNFPPVI